MKLTLISVTSCLALVLTMLAGCVDPPNEITPDAQQPPKVCSLTPIARITETNPGLGFVAMTRQADGTVLVASTSAVYKADVQAGTFKKIAGNPDPNHQIVAISAAPGQPTLVLGGFGIYRLDGTSYTLLATAPGYYGFSAIAQEENQPALVTVGRDLYTFDLATNQLTFVSASPDGYFFNRISRKAGLDALVSTSYRIYRYTNGSLTPVLTAPEYPYEQVTGLGQAISQGFVFVTDYTVLASDVTGAIVVKLATMQQPDYLRFKDVSVAGIDDILVCSGMFLYRLDVGCVKDFAQ